MIETGAKVNWLIPKVDTFHSSCKKLFWKYSDTVICDFSCAVTC